MTAQGAARVLAASAQPWFWLDGEGAAPGERRVSYLGVASEVREAVRGEERKFLASLSPTKLRKGEAGAQGLNAGWIVALGYEFGVGLLGAEPKGDEVAPAFALRCDAVLVVDHDTNAQEFRGDQAAVSGLRRLLADAEETTCLTAVEPPSSSGLAPRDPARNPAAAIEPSAWRNTAYEEAVQACREAIRAGDAYVLCLTDTAESHTGATPIELYERLRGGAMRGGVIALGDRALVSASPERFLSVHGRSVSTHPIKGTRPRGETPAIDAALAADLAMDPKERAENLMIVDLMRNDLARVCEPGSVRVERFLTVETHPRVHQLVSTVTGHLRAGCDVGDAIEACFPGGSMTGAPKRSAVEILAGLESGPRGLYSGCFGWIDDAGDAELAMTIRGIELRGRGLSDSTAMARALVGAGGGITIDSDPAAERRERDLKAAAMLANLWRSAG